MSSRFLVSKVLEVGVPPPSFSEHRSILVHFHDFKELSSKKGVYEETLPFKLFNHTWRISVAPGGDQASPADDMISVALHLDSIGKIRVKYWFIVRDDSGKIIKKTGQDNTFGQEHSGHSGNVVSRSTILEKVAINGTFTIELLMTPVSDSKSKYCKHYIPANRAISGSTILQGSIISSLLFDEESADICFDVSSPSDDTKQSVKIYAHQCILKARAPALARLCVGYNVSNSMPINDVEPDIFRELMRFVYGLNMDDTDWEEDAQALLEAANKYDVANLKVTAEAWYVTYFEFTADNVTDQFLYADAMSCPLLKESTVNFMVDNGIDVFSSDSFNAVLDARGLTRELFLMMAKKLDSSSNSAGVDSMSIDSLRIQLDAENNLSIDGDREILVRRLVDHYKSCLVSDGDTQEETDTLEEEDEDQINANEDAGGDDDQDN